MRIMYTLVALVGFVICTFNCSAAPIDEQFKTPVGFVYALKTDGSTQAYGTGFFVGVKNPDATNGVHYVYFVTAKHVLKTPDRKNWLPLVFLRLNKKDGTSEFGKIELVTTGKKKTVYTHEDESVDIAVIPMAPDQNVYDYKFIPDSMLATTNDIHSLKIREGSDIFFTGLFTPYTGKERNYPICRFGRVALLTDEKIDWDGHPSDLVLVETGAYGGNSGSPVYYYLGADREPGSLFAGAVIKLAGVMKGHYLDTKPIQTLDLTKVDVSQSNMGIAAVVPAEKIRDILFGKDLKKIRGF